FPPPTTIRGRARVVSFDADQIGAVGQAGAFECSLQFRKIGDIFGQGAQGGRVGGKIDVGCPLTKLQAIDQHIVEGSASAALLKAVDASVATVVEHHNDQFFIEHDRG